MRLLIAGVLAVLPLCATAGQTVTLLAHDAVVWSDWQTIRGTAPSVPGAQGTIFVNGIGTAFAIPSSGDTFAVAVHLSDGVNSVWAVMDSAGVPVASDTLLLTMGYRIRPDIEASASIAGRAIHLSCSLLDNPDSVQMLFHWTQGLSNPAVLSLSGAEGPVCEAAVPQGAPPGEYVFTVTAACSDGDTVSTGILVTVEGDSLRVFNPRTDHSRWIDSAVVYGITPSIFVENGTFTAITAKIPEIAQNGVTALWIQPVYATHGRGQGYDVIDYFRVRPDLGDESSLRQMIVTAHQYGLKVLLDFIPNHSSIYHPYAVHAAVNGTASHYYEYYQHEVDNAPYSQHYHSYGGFINYFWDELPNFNYNNPEVQRMILEAGKYWIEKFDIDGYRVDAAWGVNARKPVFMQTWRLALKRLKPTVFLLGEDKASWASTFDARFDAAYDWARQEAWVSQWVWQTSYSTSSNPTIFNSSNQATRVAALRTAMTNGGTGYAPNAKILRFMENNDTFRFLATHDLPRTKMVAAMMFSLTGVPLLFNGQEVGNSTHPYDAFQIFVQNKTIASMDRSGLVPFYRGLCAMRKRFAPLWGNNFEEVPLRGSATLYAYRRWEGRENVLCAVNLGASATSATISLPVNRMDLDSTKTYFLSDQLSGEFLECAATGLDSLSLTVPGYTTRIFVIDTLKITSVEEQQLAAVERPAQSTLEPNYPNPFNPSTSIAYTVGVVSGERLVATKVRLAVYDVLGREVAVLVDGPQEAGYHQVRFDATGLASGVYFCRLEVRGEGGPFVQTRRMMLVR